MIEKPNAFSGSSLPKLNPLFAPDPRDRIALAMIEHPPVQAILSMVGGREQIRAPTFARPIPPPASDGLPGGMARLKEMDEAIRDHETRLAAIEARPIENNLDAGLLREGLKLANKLSARDGYVFGSGIIVALVAVVLVFIFKK